jgi:subtilisin family serine protease
MCTAALTFAQPSLQVTPSTLSFSFPANGMPADQTLTVTNVGSLPVTATILTRQTQAPAAAAQSALNIKQVYAAANFTSEFATDRVIVVLKDGQSQLAASSATAGSLRSMRELATARTPRSGIRAHHGRRVMLARLSSSSRAEVLRAVEELRKDPNVAYVQPDYRLSALDIPNDPDFPRQYHLDNIGQTSGGVVDADIDAPEAWSLQKSARRVIIGLIDTGIDYLHPDLADNVWTNPGEIPGNGIDDDNNGFIDDVHGWDFANNDNDPMDDNMHGTHCAGIIAAAGNNGIGVCGVAWQAQIMGLKFLDATGNGYTSSAINAINYAAAMGVKLTSNSWGGAPFDQALSDAIAGSNALFVAAAGNNSADVDAYPHYPAGYSLDNILSVAASTSADGLAYFSNYGAYSVDVAAPGEAIYSTTPREQTTAMLNRTVPLPAMYGELSGTSMATPIVSGIAALIMERNTILTAGEVKSIIMNSVDYVAGLQGKCQTSGRVNLEKALQNTPAAWLTASPVSLVLAAGQTGTVTVHVDPTSLIAGTWQGEVKFNAPGISGAAAPVTATIAACKSLSAPATLTFGTTYAATPVTRYLRVNNTCNSSVTIDAINSSNPAFTIISALPLRVDPFSHRDIAVQLLSPTAGNFNTLLSIQSDAENAAVLEVEASGTVRMPPSVTIAPTSLTGSTVVGGSVADHLTISNNGGSDLTFSISAITAGQPWLSFAPAAGIVPAGGSAAIDVVMNAAELTGAVHAGELRITHNVPGQTSPGIVPVTFTVSGQRKLSAQPLVLNLDPQVVPRPVTFTHRSLSSSLGGFITSKIVDLDGDHDLDILVCNENFMGGTSRILWLENPDNHSGRYIEHIVAESGTNRAGFMDVNAADIDGDGDLDLIAAVAIPFNAGKVLWLENNGKQLFSERVVSENVKYCEEVIAVDLDRDGRMDILSVSGSDNKLSWFRNNAGQTFTETVISTNLMNAQTLDIGDIDRDGDLDIVTASYNDNKIAWFENNGSQNFTEQTIDVQLDKGANCARLADLDNDGDLDIAGSFLSGGYFWYQNDGTGSFTIHTIMSGDGMYYEVLPADFDRDGDLDLLIARWLGSDYSFSWLENNGSASFGNETTLYAGADCYRGFSSGDLDGDGDPDIVAGVYRALSDLPKVAYSQFTNEHATNAGHVQLVNAGTEAVKVSDLTVSDNQFQLTTVSPLIVPAQDSVSVNVIYRPTSSASASATLTIQSDATDNPTLTARINGSGTTAITLPGRIQAEDYKAGGEGVGYHDLTVGNSGSQYRTDNVDIEATTDVGGGYNVGWTDAGEWLAYDVNVNQTGRYDITARMASANSGSKTMSLSVDGAVVSTFIHTDASGWQSWKDVKISGITLSAGPHTLRLNMVTGGFNLNYVDVVQQTNSAPVANAGADQTVGLNASVTLDGRGSSDPDNGPQPLSYSWSQISGATVTLTGAQSAQPTFTATAAGAYSFRLTVSDGAASASDEMTVTVSGNGISLPGRIQAEDYKSGGEGVGYHDNTAGNTGGQFRTDNVDIEATTDVGGGYNVGWIESGEWLAYNVNVAQSGNYTFTARVASGAAGTKSLYVTVDGVSVGSLMSFTTNSGWQGWSDVVAPNVSLTAGAHELRIYMNTGNFNLNYLDVARQGNQAPVANAGADQTVNLNTHVTLDGRGSNDPDNGPQALSYSWSQISGTSVSLTGAQTAQPTFTPDAAGSYSFRLTVSDGAASASDEVIITVNGTGISLPGRIQAEDYKTGGEGIGYHDQTTGNTGGQYRTDNVDIETTSDVSGGYDVGWTESGEWLAYNVNVSQSGTYSLIARVASGVTGTKSLYVTIDGTTTGGLMSFTSSSGWQSWTDVTASGVALTAGAHELRIYMNTADFNLNYLDVIQQTEQNLITNGDFSNGLTGWSPVWISPASGIASDDGQAAKIAIDAAGTNPWDVQLFQESAIFKDKTYQLEFYVKSETIGKNFKVVVEHNGDPWTKYLEQPLQFTQAGNTWQKFTVQFFAPVNDYSVKIGFHFGAANVSDVWLDNVTMIAK